MPDWLKHHAWWIALLSLAVSLLILLISIRFLVALPADHFLPDRPIPTRDRHPAIRLLLLVLKNALGCILILLGFLMSLPLIPGPGLLTLLIGLLLTNFPGKHRLELKLLHIPFVIRPINLLRTRSGRPPLQLPPKHI